MGVSRFTLVIMKTSSNFEKALFYEDPEAINDYYKSRVDQLFELSEDRSYIEFHVQRPDSKYGSEKRFNSIVGAPQWDSDGESDSASMPSSPVKEPKQSAQSPPYIQAPVFRRKISNVQCLASIAVVSL